MKSAAWILALAISAMSIGAAAPEDRVTVPVATVGEQELHVLVIKDVVRAESPRVKVRGGKVLLRDGMLVSWLHPRAEDRKALSRLMRSSSLVFRLYHGETGVGIYSYRLMSKDDRPDGRGVWLEALPLDKDATFQELTRGAREEADLMNLLELNLDAVDDAIEREEVLNSKITDAVAREWTTLDDGEAFFVATRRR